MVLAASFELCSDGLEVSGKSRLNAEQAALCVDPSAFLPLRTTIWLGPEWMC